MEKGKLKSWLIDARYRTATQCNTKRVAIVAVDFDTAAHLASQYVRRTTAAVRIDGGEQVGSCFDYVEGV